MFLKNDSKNFEKGATLIEIVVALVIIAIFSLIVINDFPKIKKQFALSRAAYKLSQDIRRAEDYGFSGVRIIGSGGAVVDADGYGLYVNKLINDRQYIIYADTDGNGDKKFTEGTIVQCSQTIPAGSDCIIETINIEESDTDVYIKRIDSVNDLSINFTPPNPTVTITPGSNPVAIIGIVLGLGSDNSLERIVYINSTGLVYVE